MPDLVPAPRVLTTTDGETLTLDDSATLDAATLDADSGLAALADTLRSALGLPLPATADGTVRLAVDTRLAPEGYHLTVSDERVELTGGSPAGVFYGVQTLRQLLPAGSIAAPSGPVTLPVLSIEDEPAFGWRGAMLDVGRNFLPLEDVRAFIDSLAVHKLNTLHLHITEDQGWRFEVRGWPKLTEIGSQRSETVVGHAHGGTEFDGTPHGGFYTQDELRDLVGYAEERFVRIVPEIDLPGHTQAARAAYPELGYDGARHEVWTTWGISEHIIRVDEPGMAFVRDVLTELMDVFPSPYVHIGGDEAPKVEWEASEVAQAQRERLGLADMDGLQNWFTGELAGFIESKGRRLVGWDEILEGGDLPPGVLVMAWRGVEPGIEAARRGLDTVMAPTTYTYLDYLQGPAESEPLGIGGNLTLEQVYGFDPVPAELTEDEAKRIVGVSGQLWREYMPTAEHTQYMAFPRLAAIAEIGWTYRDRGDVDDFRRRLTTHLDRLAALGVNYRPLD